MVSRVYVEKKPGFDGEAKQLKEELRSLLGVGALENLRMVNRYDVEGISDELFAQCVPTVFSEPQSDIATLEKMCIRDSRWIFRLDERVGELVGRRRQHRVFGHLEHYEVVIRVALRLLDYDGCAAAHGRQSAHAQRSVQEVAAGEQDVYKRQASDAVASLPEVDFSVGKEAFVSEWTSRINAYLAGSPLAGQGATFAEAAWSNGVDPRWSPAISNTESSKGAHCFLPYNAWGWGDKSWSSWEEAINAHVAGLANGYGYSITYANAAKYCPPNTDHWFKATIGQMKMI